MIPTELTHKRTGGVLSSLLLSPGREGSPGEQVGVAERTEKKNLSGNCQQTGVIIHDLLRYIW